VSSSASPFLSYLALREVQEAEGMVLMGVVLPLPSEIPSDAVLTRAKATVCLSSERCSFWKVREKRREEEKRDENFAG
jgi:hypothetical protein